MLRKLRLIAVLSLCLVPAVAGAQEGDAVATPAANWLTLDQFLQQPNIEAASAQGKPPAQLLPSLGSERAVAPLLVPVVVKPVEFAALPPLFERVKPVPPQDAKKLSAVKKILPQLVATVEKPQVPSKAEACAPPELTKRAKNYASDSVTLEALQQAVKELKLDERLDFMQSPKTSMPPIAAAQAMH